MYVHCNLTAEPSNDKKIIKWLFVHGPSCLTHECNIGPDDHHAESNIAFWRSPGPTLTRVYNIGPILYV